MGYIYLICDPETESYKIGVTRQKDCKRIKQLQTGNPTQLHISFLYKCEYPFRLETMLHNYYKNKNILNEWFQLKNEEVIEFKELCNKFNNQIDILKSNPFFSKGLK